MATLDDLAQRIDQLVLRHQELKRTTALIAQQLVNVTSERDSLRSRLAAARARVDALLERLPSEAVRAGTGGASSTTDAPALIVQHRPSIEPHAAPRTEFGTGSNDGVNSTLKIEPSFDASATPGAQA